MRRRRISSARAEGGDDDNRVALPVMSGRGTVVGVVLAILVVGLGAAAVLYRQSEREADREQDNVAARAVKVVQAQEDALRAALSGGSAIVDADGRVELRGFDTFARSAVNTTLLPVLAYVQIVPGADRAVFEAQTGVTITQPGDAGLVRAGERDRYLPVRYVYPITETSSKVVGFDVASEPARASAAELALRTGSLTFSVPVASQPSGQMSFFVTVPLFQPGMSLATEGDRRGASVGYLSALISADTLITAVSDQLPAGARVAITDDATLLASTPSSPVDGTTIDIDVGQRSWHVTAEYHIATHDTAWLMLLGTIGFALAAGLFLQRNVRQTDELRAAAVSVRQLARLSQSLAVADSREEMMSIIGAHATDLFSASAVRVVPAADLGQESLLVRQVASDDVATFVADRAAMRDRSPDLEPRWSADGTYSAAAVPLHRPAGDLLGVIEWSWPRSNRFRGAARSTLLATAEVCQQSLYGSEVRDRRWQSASALTDLSQRLSVSRNLDQIAQAIVDLGPPASGCDAVAIGFVGASGTHLDVFHGIGSSRPTPRRIEFPINSHGRLMAVLKSGQPIQFDHARDIARYPALAALVPPDMHRMVCFPLVDSVGELRGVIVFAYLEGSDRTEQPEAGRLATIADLAAQTVERSLLYQHEHELVLNLQRQTLGDLPSIEGVQIAARYLPASSSLGLGGDWYDVHALNDGCVAIVVGDVVGHGIDAIADMTQFRTTISTLLRTNPRIEDVPSMSTSMLTDPSDDEVRFATAGLMVVDVEHHSMRYVRAGHPPAVLRTPDGEIVVLEQRGGTPIGIPSPIAPTAMEVDLPAGTIVVAYTDGLVERREEPFDVGLQRLADGLRRADVVDVELLTDALVEHCLGERQTDDDAALLVFRVL